MHFRLIILDIQYIFQFHHYFVPLFLYPLYRCEHLQAITKVAHEGHDGHPLWQPFDLAEKHHEPVLISEPVHWPSLPLILAEHLHLTFSRHEPHQTLHEIHRHCTKVKPEGMRKTDQSAVQNNKNPKPTKHKPKLGVSDIDKNNINILGDFLDNDN